jgi:hypothetical protein
MNKLWLVAGSFVGAIFLIWQFTYNNENYYSGFQKNHVYGLHNSIDVDLKPYAVLRRNDDE